jgi:hypothetical protein
MPAVTAIALVVDLSARTMMLERTRDPVGRRDAPAKENSSGGETPQHPED